MPATIVWFRTDLRLADQPALAAAVKRGTPILPLFIWSPEEESPWAPGGASRWWLHQSLTQLDKDLQSVGSRLTLRRGPAFITLCEVVRAIAADAVFWNRRYEPAVVERDGQIKESLRAAGIVAKSFNASLLLEPGKVMTRATTPFRVFTPFWNACLQSLGSDEVQPAPTQIAHPPVQPESLPLSALQLEPRINWAATMRTTWQPGEAGAHAALDQFIESGLAAYPDDRNRPDLSGSSRLSPHLHFGEIGPRQVWRAVERRLEASHQPGLVGAAEVFLKELGWREFAHHLLFHFPTTTHLPLREEFTRFPWANDAPGLHAWQRGSTGYPIVDAGMRELWATGWMHNRVRMIAASFLVKDLLLPWQSGAQWFWDTLVDADLSNNTLGWQWTAGCGADAAPYFRIFNPTLQGKKFDPDGSYVRQWVPALGGLSHEWIHEPWKAPLVVLRKAGVVLGETYPERIVDHSEARERALAALASLKH